MKPPSRIIACTARFDESDVVVIRLLETEYGSSDTVGLARASELLLDQAKASGPTYVIVDLTAVQYLGAAFIGIIVSAWNELKKQNRRLVLSGLNPYPARLFHTLHLDRLFPIRANLQDALEQIGAQRRPGVGDIRKSATIRAQVSEVEWDPELVRVQYSGPDGEPIRSVIVPRTPTETSSSVANHALKHA